MEISTSYQQRKRISHPSTCLILRPPPPLCCVPGNWHEDQYGCDLLANSAAASYTSASPLSHSHSHSRTASRLWYPQTTTSSTFTTAGHDIIHASVYEEKTQPRMSPEVDKSLLFPHKGSDPIDRRYQTSYLTSYCAGTPAPVDKTIKSLAPHEPNSNEETREESRFRTYRTTSSDAFNVKNSILAIRADETSTQMTRAGGNARAGQLAQSLEANYRKLRLRKD